MSSLLLCRLHWHRWTVWGTPESVTVYRGTASDYGSPLKLGTSLVKHSQKRQCVRCGIVDVRWLKGGTPADD